MLAGDGARRPCAPSRAEPLASRAVPRRRDRHARRGLHLQRHSRPQARRRGRAHPQSPAAVGPGDDRRGGGVPRRSGAGRPRGAAQLQPLLDLARDRFARRRRGLPADEARDFVAAGGARPRLLLGRADGLERDLRQPRARRRSCSTSPPSHGRSATTRSTRCRTRATTPSSASARPPDCSANRARLGVGLFYAASAALALAAIELAGGGAIALAGWLAFCGHLAWQVSGSKAPTRRRRCRLFRSNRDAGFLLFAGIAVEGWVGYTLS